MFTSRSVSTTIKTVKNHIHNGILYCYHFLIYDNSSETEISQQERSIWMNLLPDMIIIDFCEWLKHRISSRQKTLDFYDLMLNQEHRYILENYAEEFLYIQNYGKIIKRTFHRFIDSSEFDCCLSECKKYHHIHFLI